MPNGSLTSQASLGREDDRPSRRQGAMLSTRQIARAASYGRRITCRFLSTHPASEVVGYVVGADDFHWMLASVVPVTERVVGSEPITLSLIHKSRVDMILLHPKSTLSTEDPEAHDALRHVGQSFWRYCEATYSR